MVGIHIQTCIEYNGNVSLYFSIPKTIYTIPGPVQRSYFRGPIPLTHDAAGTYCQSQGATLASIPTQSNWNDARSICGGVHCWIGLRDNINEGTWSWDDGTRVSNSYGFKPDRSATTGQGPWNTGEPNNSGGHEDCIMMYTSAWNIGGKYNDAGCHMPYYPLCSVGMYSANYLCFL